MGASPGGISGYPVRVTSVMTCYACTVRPGHFTSRHVTPCHIMLCRVVSCHVMAHHVTSCHRNLIYLANGIAALSTSDLKPQFLVAPFTRRSENLSNFLFCALLSDL